MARAVYQVSPFGIAMHPWLTKPDTKFVTRADDKGVFKVHLHLKGAEAQELMEKIRDASDEAFKDYMDDPDKGGKIKKADKDKWSVFYPFTEILGADEETPTGEVAFSFKQNAEIKLRDGTVKALTITVVDGANKAVVKPVFSGSEVRVMYAMRPIAVVGAKVAGVKLDFAQVQVRKLSEGNAPGFGEVEGYRAEDDEEHHSSMPKDEGASKDTGGDY